MLTGATTGRLPAPVSSSLRLDRISPSSKTADNVPVDLPVIDRTIVCHRTKTVLSGSLIKEDDGRLMDGNKPDIIPSIFPRALRWKNEALLEKVDLSALSLGAAPHAEGRMRAE
jgi:hypothetical protein